MSKLHYTHERKACQFCGDQISVNRMAFHVETCKRITDDQREVRKARRALYSNGHKVPSVSRRVPNKRVHIAVSFDLESFKEIVMQLAPSFTLDKVTIQ